MPGDLTTVRPDSSDNDGFNTGLYLAAMSHAYAVTNDERYGLSFSFLSLTMETIPVGVAYAIWSGAGLVMITAVAWLTLGQALDRPAVVGMALILAGVLVLNLFSRGAGRGATPILVLPGKAAKSVHSQPSERSCGRDGQSPGSEAEETQGRAGGATRQLVWLAERTECGAHQRRRCHADDSAGCRSRRTA
ncbi:MAG: multidrug efflux SMR transporter [Pirellulales bacterium]|jgi:multidrug transporter EmrE-like cation transporter|nr:multidrug efflux SMR transporter [Pirellulales bacterium]